MNKATLKRILLISVSIWIAFLLQTTFCKWISFGLASANLCLVVTVSIGFLRGKKAGIFTGFFCGLLIDVFFGLILGFYALCYMFLGYLCGFLCDPFHHEEWKYPILLVTGCDLALNLFVYVIFFLLRGRFHIGMVFLRIILPEAVYSIVFALLIYPFLRFLFQKIEDGEKVKETKNVSGIKE